MRDAHQGFTWTGLCHGFLSAPFPGVNASASSICILRAAALQQPAMCVCCAHTYSTPDCMRHDLSLNCFQRSAELVEHRCMIALGDSSFSGPSEQYHHRYNRDLFLLAHPHLIHSYRIITGEQHTHRFDTISATFIFVTLLQGLVRSHAGKWIKSTARYPPVLISGTHLCGDSISFCTAYLEYRIIGHQVGRFQQPRRFQLRQHTRLSSALEFGVYTI